MKGALLVRSSLFFHGGGIDAVDVVDAVDVMDSVGYSSLVIRFFLADFFRNLKKIINFAADLR